MEWRSCRWLSGLLNELKARWFSTPLNARLGRIEDRLSTCVEKNIETSYSINNPYKFITMFYLSLEKKHQKKGT